MIEGWFPDTVLGRKKKKTSQEGNRQNFGDRETLVSRGKRTRIEALLREEKIEWYGGNHPGQKS